MEIRDALLALLILLAIAPRSASQTETTSSEHSCGYGLALDGPACQATWLPDISVVFLGRAGEVREEAVPIVLDGEKALTQKLYVTFQVEESFRGVSEKVIQVVSGGDLCGFPFSKGIEYLIYGRRLPNGDVYVSISSPTKWKKEAAKNLQYLRGLARAPHGATIYGRAFRYTVPENPRAMVGRPGVADRGRKIEIQGAGQNYETTVDRDGNLKLSALAPGRYVIVLKATRHSISRHQLNPRRLTCRIRAARSLTSGWIRSRKKARRPRAMRKRKLGKQKRRRSSAPFQSAIWLLSRSELPRRA